MPIQEFDYPEDVLRARGLLQDGSVPSTQASAQELPAINESVDESAANPDAVVTPAPQGSSDRPPPKISPELQKYITQQLQAAQTVGNTSETVIPEGPTVELTPAKYVPKKAVNASSVALPSKFIFYDFPDLFVGKFKTRHYGLLHEAHITHSIESLLECVSDVLSTSNPAYAEKPLAFYLTIPDFYWVLYYLRLNQTKVSLTHNTTCSNPLHHQAVVEEKLSAETLKITQQVTRSSIHTKELGAAPDMSQFEFEEFTLAPARMLDVVESMHLPDYEQDADFRYLCRVASMIRPKSSPDAPIEVRLAMVEDLEYEDLARIGQYEQIVTAYGPDEFINVTCKECGHQRKTKITLDARSFLPLQ